MYRSLALLALPLLAAGCHSSSAPTTIDSFRSSYFNGQQSPAASPSTASQVAAMPQPIPAPASDEANAAPKADPSTGDAKSSQATAASSKKAGPLPYKASVAAYIQRYAVDSNSLKLAKISTPFQSSVNGQKGSVVCVELGGTSGNSTAYLLKDNAVTDSEFGAKACQGKQMAPWDDSGST
jgi:hypothetical protein